MPRRPTTTSAARPSRTTGEMVDRRALNRATLARQLLLERDERPVPDAVAHLVGLQAQTPHTWYVGLWTRLAGFRPEDAADLLAERRLVRIALMRSTIHLVTADDCLALRPLVQPVIERSMSGNFGKRLAGLNRAELVAAARDLVAAEPLTYAEIGRRLAARWPDHDPAALAQGARAWLPLVQVPPRGLWGQSGPIAHTTTEAWLGRPLDPAPSLEAMVRRYLGAFGPASVMDVQTWSGLTKLREVVDRLRPGLRAFRDEQGRELFDLPDAPRPDPATPAPPRFLYDFDNLLLSHADRGRVVTDAYRRLDFPANGAQPSILLLDGFTAGTWQVARRRGAATLTVRPFAPISAADEAAVADEGANLLAFVAPGDSHDLRFAPPDGGSGGPAQYGGLRVAKS